MHLAKSKTDKNDNAFSIFIADDDENISLLLQSQLNILAKNITLVTDANLAHSYLLKNKYNLIFIATETACLNGSELIKLINRPDSKNQDTAIIAITTHTQDRKKQTLINTGFDECITKPICIKQLSEILNLWLPNKDSHANMDDTEEFDYVAALLKRTIGNTELTTTLFHKLFKELAEQLLTIEKAINSGDLKLAIDITHMLHGSVSSCGFTDIQYIAKKLEIDLPKNNPTLIKTNYLALKNKINEFLRLEHAIFEKLSRLCQK